MKKKSRLQSHFWAKKNKRKPFQKDFSWIQEPLWLQGLYRASHATQSATTMQNAPVKESRQAGRQGGYKAVGDISYILNLLSTVDSLLFGASFRVLWSPQYLNLWASCLLGSFCPRAWKSSANTFPVLVGGSPPYKLVGSLHFGFLFCFFVVFLLFM